MQHPLSQGLQHWIGETEPARFLREDYERRARYFPSTDRHRFDGLLTSEQLLEQECSSAHHVRAAGLDRRGWNREWTIEPRDARKMVELGFTLGVTALAPSGAVAPLLEGFHASFQSAVAPNINAYLSPDGCGYGLHFDPHPVWIFQLEGAKQWTFSKEPEVRHPASNVVFPPDRDRVRLPWVELERPDVTDRERFEVVTLQAGEVLYLPAGCWHAAEARGSSFALTLALGGISTIDLAFLALKHSIAHQGSAMARRLPAIPRQDNPTRKALFRRIEAELAQLAQELTQLDADTLDGVLERAAAPLGIPPSAPGAPSLSRLPPRRAQAASMNWLTKLSATS